MPDVLCVAASLPSRYYYYTTLHHTVTYSTMLCRLCMAVPQQLLYAVTGLRAVTSARVSGDGGRPYFNSGSTQLLVAALGLVGLLLALGPGQSCAIQL